MSYIHNEEADFAASELARMFIAESDLCFAGVDEADRPHFNAFASKEPSNTSWPIADGVISLVNANDRDDVAMEYKRDTEGVHGLLTVEMYDPLGHFVYFESHGGFSYESGRKRNTTQATSSRARS